MAIKGLSKPLSKYIHKLQNQQISAARMADAISPRRHQYALATHEQTNEQINKQKFIAIS